MTAPHALPREVAPDVFCLPLPGRTQTNVYFVRSGTSWALIDAGWANDGPVITQAAEAVFGAESRPAAILPTHAHPDHSGAAQYLARRWGCPVFVHPDELPLAQGDWAAITAATGPLDRWILLPLMRALGRARREVILGRARPEDAQPFDPSDGVPGLPGWQCIPTPGHTPGHVSFFRPRDRVLVSGDALVTLELNSVAGMLWQRPGFSGPPWYTTWDWTRAKASMARLAGLDPLVLAPGHGAPLAGVGVAPALRAVTDAME